MRQFIPIFPILLIIVIVSPCYAQNTDKTACYIPFVEVSGGERFTAFSKMTVRQPMNMYQAGGLFGVEMEQPRGASFINTGLLLDNYRFSLDELKTNQITTSFLDIPVDFGYRFQLNDAFSLSASLGLSFLICYHYGCHYSDDHPDFEMSCHEMKENRGVGANVGFCAEYAFSDRFSLCASTSSNFYFQYLMMLEYLHEIEIPNFINVRLGVKYRWGFK